MAFLRGQDDLKVTEKNDKVMLVEKTRNRDAPRGTRVRIPPSPPSKDTIEI